MNMHTKTTSIHRQNKTKPEYEKNEKRQQPTDEKHIDIHTKTRKTHADKKNRTCSRNNYPPVDEKKTHTRQQTDKKPICRQNTKSPYIRNAHPPADDTITTCS